ncbi:MAG: NAD(P)-dependent alcohol dehydrogenase [Chloroflexi bacterium]|nr:NAD(P)-dependent alcohol dehydrogenase [Chloroflexota bacterium]
MAKTRAWAASREGPRLTPYEFDPGPLRSDEVEIETQYCGLCHSDISLINNDWEGTRYPLVPGHEAVGRIAAVGRDVHSLKVGQTVGVGWMARSDMRCPSCLAGNHNLCDNGESTCGIRNGGFAERIRVQELWAFPIPKGIDASSAAPLLDAGTTVFSPLLLHNVKPTSRVGVVGIGGLGHLALQFCTAWGCEVTAFTHTPSKKDDCLKMGASRVLSSRNKKDMAAVEGKLDMLLICTYANLDWESFFSTVAPGGRMHFVGTPLEPLSFTAFDFIDGQRGITGSVIGSPLVNRMMLEFAERHKIVPWVEHLPMSRVNEAITTLEAGKARYRLVLDADW